MNERPFETHRQAALALLNQCPNLAHKAAGFLGHVAVAPSMSERQREWLETLLKRNSLPPLAREAAR